MASQDTELLIRGANVIAAMRDANKSGGSGTTGRAPLSDARRAELQAKRDKRRGARPGDEASYLAQADSGDNYNIKGEFVDKTGTQLRRDPYSDEIADAFGQDQGQFYDYQEGDMQYGEQQMNKMQEAMMDMEDRTSDERRQYDRSGVILKPGIDPNEYDDIAAEVASRRELREDVTPGIAMQQLQREVQSRADNQPKGIAALAGSVFGGGFDQQGAQEVVQNLDQYIKGEQQARQAERELGAGYASVDIGRQNPEAMEANNWRAQADARQAMREGKFVNVPFMQRGNSVPEMPLVAAVGDQGQAGPGVYEFVDPRTGEKVNVQQPANGEISGINTPDTGNQLNAPTSNNDSPNVPVQQNSVDSWVNQMKPEFRQQGGRSFGDFPQADIGGVTADVANAVRALEQNPKFAGKGLGRMQPNIRSLEELEQVAAAVAGIGGQAGQSFFAQEMQDVEGGGQKMVKRKVTDPGVGEVLNFLRIPPARQKELANALIQLEVAKQRGSGGAYFERGATPQSEAEIVFDAPEAVNRREGAVPVERIRAGQRVPGGKGDIGAAFRQLQEPGARQPFIGQVEGEAPRINQFKPGGMGSGPELVRNLQSQAIQRGRENRKPVDRGRLKENIGKALAVEERMKRDEVKRQERIQNVAAPKEPGIGGISTEVRARQMAEQEQRARRNRRGY